MKEAKQPTGTNVGQSIKAPKEILDLLLSNRLDLPIECVNYNNEVVFEAMEIYAAQFKPQQPETVLSDGQVAESVEEAIKRIYGNDSNLYGGQRDGFRQAIEWQSTQQNNAAIQKIKDRIAELEGLKKWDLIKAKPTINILSDILRQLEA